jgi:quercetin dioxygenase-like cupin family protein
MKKHRWPLGCLCFAALPFVTVAWAGNEVAAGGNSQPTPTYAYATNGVIDNIQGPFDSKLKLLLNESNLGGKELEAAEMTLAPGTTVPSHMHASVEIIYVLSGTYGHEVNGRLYLLKPGQIGIVRPGDKVRHLTMKDAGAKILILWAPAGDGRALSMAKGAAPDPIPEAHPEVH